MKIFFDFDRTLFDTDALKSDVDQYIKDIYNIRDDLLEKSHRPFSGVYGKTGEIFTPRKYSEIIASLIHTDSQEVYENLMKFYGDNLSRYVFAGTEDFLKNYGADESYILSYGQKEFQELKIRNSGLYDYFEKVIVSQKNKIDEIMEHTNFPDEKFVIVDDANSYFHDIKKTSPHSITIHFVKDEEECNNSNCDAHVEKISEIHDILLM